MACQAPYAKATTFRQLIDLVRAAEARLAAAGISSAVDQIHALRGVYYGTRWSLDYSVEHSDVRNEGFQRFTRPSQDPAANVAGFVVATGSPTAVTAPSLPAGRRLSDALNDYLGPGAAGPSAAWTERAKTFLRMYGGTFDPAGALTNRSALIATFTPKIQTFACNYLASRVKDGKMAYNEATRAADHVVPAASEVATAFVDALVDSARTGGPTQATRFPSPGPAVPGGACGAQIAAGRLGSIFGQ